MFINKSLLTNKNLINLLISLFPLFLILGNLAININIILICLLGTVIYGADIFKVDKKFYVYSLFSFFLYLILITLIKNLPNLDVNNAYGAHIAKSFFFLRFFIFFLVVNKLLERNDFNTKLFFIFASFFSLLVSFDILIQVMFGKDLLGYSITHNRPSGFFGSEHIAGGFLQKFSLFFIFFCFYFKHQNNNLKINFFIISGLLLFFISILLTNNKMPFVIYVFSILFFYFIEKRFKIFFTFFFLAFIILIFFSNYTPSAKNKRMNDVKYSINAFSEGAKVLLKYSPKLFMDENYKNDALSITPSGYLFVFNSGVQVWKKNKILGNGLKSFRLNCVYKNFHVCNTHPHNYVIEIMIDTGILGLFLIYSIVIFSLFKFYIHFAKNFTSPLRFLQAPFFLIVLFEFFPLRSSGSFFTTNNAVIIFLMLAILINTSRLNFNKK
jgi:O-antigen ligase